MVDAMIPANEAAVQGLEEDKTLLEILELADNAAKMGVENTIPLIAKKGRAKFLQEKSVGHQDAGATSFSLLIEQMYQYTKESSPA